jgi:hypothetical protein
MNQLDGLKYGTVLVPTVSDITGTNLLAMIFYRIKKQGKY